MSTPETMAVARKPYACRYVDSEADCCDAFAHDSTRSRAPSAAAASGYVGAVTLLFDKRFASTIYVGNFSRGQYAQTLADNAFRRVGAALEWKF